MALWFRVWGAHTSTRKGATPRHKESGLQAVPNARSRALRALLLRGAPSGRSRPPAPLSPWLGSAPFLRSACTSSSRPIAAASRRLCSQCINTRHRSQQSQHPSLSLSLSHSLARSLGTLSRPARPHHRASTRPRRGFAADLSGFLGLGRQHWQLDQRQHQHQQRHSAPHWSTSARRTRQIRVHTPLHTR